MAVKKFAFLFVAILILGWIFYNNTRTPENNFQAIQSEIKAETIEITNSANKTASTSAVNHGSPRSWEEESFGKSHQKSNPSVNAAKAINQGDIKNSGKTGSKTSQTSDSLSGSLVEPTNAKGAVDALYQAILWREPDSTGGANAIEKFSKEGWNTYIDNAKTMITSPEFGDLIIPNHSTQEIINRIYAVFLGRCASPSEMNKHYVSLTENNPGKITFAVLHQAKDSHIKQIFAGGYKPESCRSPTQ